MQSSGYSVIVALCMQAVHSVLVIHVRVSLDLLDKRHLTVHFETMYNVIYMDSMTMHPQHHGKTWL